MNSGHHLYRRAASPAQKAHGFGPEASQQTHRAQKHTFFLGIFFLAIF